MQCEPRATNYQKKKTVEVKKKKKIDKELNWMTLSVTLQCYCCAVCLFLCVQIFSRNSKLESTLSINYSNIPWRPHSWKRVFFVCVLFFCKLHLMVKNLKGNVFKYWITSLYNWVSFNLALGDIIGIIDIMELNHSKILAAFTAFFSQRFINANNSLCVWLNSQCPLFFFYLFFLKVLWSSVGMKRS